jgi:hypothetical protein
MEMPNPKLSGVLPCRGRHSTADKLVLELERIGKAHGGNA